MPHWECRSIERIALLDQMVWLQEGRCTPVPKDFLCAIDHTGGLVAGAYDFDRLIGIAIAFPRRCGRKRILWSYMVSVLPEYQNRGVGFGLKQFQRAWALKQRYTAIAWAFDPLHSAHANLSFHRLGAVSDVYHINFDGETGDGSDRLEVMWNLHSQQVRHLSSDGWSQPDSKGSADSVFLLKLVDDNRPVVELPLLADTLPSYCVEIPADFLSLLPSVANNWRQALRETFQFAFSQSLVVSDFVRRDRRCWYVLSSPTPWFLYVLQCSDLSLYTGVTPDLERRLSLHNAGRGASYTASRRPVNLVAAWRFRDRAAALSAENRFKGLSRQAKLRKILERSFYQGEPFIDVAG